MNANKKSVKKRRITKIFDIKLFAYDFIKWTGILPVALFYRVKKIYADKKNHQKQIKGAAIIVSNHVSFNDPLIIMMSFWKRRIFFLATKELFDKPLKKLFFKAFGCIEIDSDNANLKSFKECFKILEDNRVLTIFPEGHIGNPEKLQNFKSGAIMMAVRNNTPIIPTYVEKRKNIFYRQKIVIGEPFLIQDYITNRFPTIEEIDKMTKMLQTIEEDLKKYLEKPRRKGNGRTTRKF